MRKKIIVTLDNGQADKIIVNLDHCDSAQDIKPEHLVHQQIYKKLKDDVATSLIYVKNLGRDPKSATEDGYPLGSGQVFFIDGSRGAGKTTFLRTVYSNLPNALKNNQPPQTVTLAALDYIDPSRLEGSEIILLNILRALKNVVARHQPNLRDESLQENFRQSFKKLAGGLSLFQKGHDQLAHHDPELFFDRGLARAEDSRSLRNNLHHAIDTACQILGADALLLAFDDADTNSQHAYPVLECIRNYLDTPRLIIVATGDMELYSLLVREQFSRQLPMVKNNPDDGRHTQHSRMLDHLESQYLLKLFPLPRRYQLKTLSRLLEEKNGQVDYRLKSSAWNGERNPQSVLDEIIQRGLRVRVSSDIDLFRQHILKQPLRSVLQVLQRCASYIRNSDNAAWSQELSDALREAFRAMAQESLYKKGIVVDDLAANYLPTLTKAVFDLACEDGDVDTAAYLRPQASDDDLNNCYMALAAEVAGQCAGNPSAALNYLLAGPGSVSLWGKEKRRMAGKIDHDLLGRQFRQYMAIGRDEDALNWSRRATAVLAAEHPAQPKSPVVSFGIIGLNKRKPGAAKGAADAFETIGAILKKQEPSVLPAFAYSLLDVSSQSSRCYASIYNILGLIERLWGANSEEEVSRCLKSTYQPLSISCPDWGESIDSTVDENEDESSAIDSSEDEVTNESAINFGSLPNAILAWRDLHKDTFKSYAPSSILLGKIWIRIYFSLEKSSDKSRPGILKGGSGADEIMELSAACLINAFLVEEAAHGVSECVGKLESTNPLTSASKSLNSKMEFLEKNKDKLPLTYAIASCPLILGLLSGEAKQKLSTNLPDQINNFSVTHDLVKNAFIAGRWRKENSSSSSKKRAVE